MPTEAEIRAAHPDWTDEQVQAELADPAPQPDPQPDPTPKPDPDRDAAFARERQARKEAERRAKEAEDKLAEDARKKAEEEGRWQELAQQETQKREALEATHRTAEAKRNAERSARDLKFKDPDYALYLLAQDSVDLSDAAAVKAALDTLAATRTDLIGGTVPPPSGGPAGGARGDAPGLTKEQIEGMTPYQLKAIDPEVIRKALQT